MAEDGLWQRFRRSRTAGVLAVYAGAAWIVLQLIDVLDGIVPMPDWVGPGALVLLAIGLVVGFTVSQVVRQVDEPMIEITLTVIAAYGSFVAAEQFQEIIDLEQFDNADSNQRIRKVMAEKLVLAANDDTAGGSGLISFSIP